MKIRKELIAQRDPKSPISEVFRTLRTNIQFMNSSKKLKTLLITSTFPGEGKSWVSSNLAVTFAQAGNRVILIDADMRKGRQYTIFGAAPKPGLSNCLAEMEMTNQNDGDISRYIQKTEVENLLLIPAGSIPPNPSELLVSEQMMKLLNDLKEVCDLIIIDGTPCELVTDSVILSRIADSTMIVTAHKETKKENLDRVIKNIQNVGGKLAGVVINKMPISAKKYNEKYYYHQSQEDFEARNRAEELKRKTNNVIRQNTEAEKDKELNRNIEENKYNNEIKAESNDLERPNFVQNNSNVAMNKTNDILSQINSYLDKEKKDLN